eukprot:45127_1
MEDLKLPEIISGSIQVGYVNIVVPNYTIGRIIGKSASTITKLRNKSGIEFIRIEQCLNEEDQTQQIRDTVFGYMRSQKCANNIPKGIIDIVFKFYNHPDVIPRVIKLQGSGNAIKSVRQEIAAVIHKANIDGQLLP